MEKGCITPACIENPVSLTSTFEIGYSTFYIRCFFHPVYITIHTIHIPDSLERSDPIHEALIAAHDRGVEVRGVIDRRQGNQKWAAKKPSHEEPLQKLVPSKTPLWVTVWAEK